MRSALTQRVVLYLMLVGVAIAVLIGFWPVHAAVWGNPSYDCGSGFVHSRQDWRNDSPASRNSRTAADGKDDDSLGTPAQICPTVVYDHRDLALLIGGVSVVGGFLLFALTAPTLDRRDRAALASIRLRKRGAR
jgi:hypothetical protein